MAGETPRTFNLYSVLENPHMNIRKDTVVAVQDSISDNLMKRFIRIPNWLQTKIPKGFDFLNKKFCARYGALDLIV